MRFHGFAACLWVAFDCFDKGLGVAPQSLFASHNIWLWQVAALLWAYTAYRFLYEKEID